MYNLTRLKFEMAEQGYSVNSLAKSMGRAQSTIDQMFRRGGGRPSTVKAVADFLGVPMKKIIQSQRKKSA